MSKAGNDKVIKAAFERLAKNEAAAISAGMQRLLESAVVYALQSHDANHPDHLRFGDTYGWILFHNGSRVESKVNANDQMAGDVTNQLMKLSSTANPVGWVGIVMAGMNKPSYYSVDYEVGILNETINMTKQKFNQYFKPVK